MGNVPQALFMMNSGLINKLVHGEGKTRLSHILEKYAGEQGRDPRGVRADVGPRSVCKEESICLNYIKDAGNRREGFEDVMWSLMNSSEFCQSDINESTP